MALPDYFRRSAVAAAQVLSGFDEEAIRRRLETVTVGIASGPQAATSEGRAALELSVRLLARLYPRLALRGANMDEWASLARSINPAIELVAQEPDLQVAVGADVSAAGTTVFIGSEGWNAQLSTSTPRRVGESENPIGAAAAACLGAAVIFRAVFLGDHAKEERVFSALTMEPAASASQPLLDALQVPANTVLVGAGAIGNAALWALGASGLTGLLQVVDHEAVELSNLQRYVLATRADEGRSKTAVARQALEGRLEVKEHQVTWAKFADREGYDWERVLVALDSAKDRRAVQSSLPRWIANGWTQPGDLGVSVHTWREGACLQCLYLPKGDAPNEDQLVASALGLNDPGHQQQIRQLLLSNAAPPPELLAEAAVALAIKPESLTPFQDRSLRDLYVEGICGGAVLPLDRLGRPEQAVHVPLAHQSALSGVLLAGRMLADLLGHGPASAQATRINVLRPLGQGLTQAVGKDTRGICICQDRVYQAAYTEKWPAGTAN